MKNSPLASRFEELSRLEDGWYDGRGKVPDPSKLGVFAQNLVDGYPEGIPWPHVFPTPDGDLSLEWEGARHPTVLVDFEAMIAYYHAFGPEDGDVEAEFALSETGGCKPFLDFLAGQLRSGPA